MSSTDTTAPTVRRIPPGLTRYVVRRLAAAVVVLFAVSVGIFLFVHIAPGGPEYALAGPLASPDQLQAIREARGLDDPLISQYLDYLGSLARFDMGESFSRGTPVTDSIIDASAITIPLLLMTWGLSMTFGIVLGLITAARPGSSLDRFVLGSTILGASAPPFAVGTLFAYVFGIRLGWLPVLGAGDGGFDRLEHLILPTLTGSVTLLATCTKVSRVRIGEILEEDQMTFARARGLDRRWVVKNVVLRNAGVQLITLSGGLLILLIAAQIIVEQVFNLPGVGSLMITAIQNRDVALLQGITILVAVFVIVVNLIVDVCCMILDPRLQRDLQGAT